MSSASDTDDQANGHGRTHVGWEGNAHVNGLRNNHVDREGNTHVNVQENAHINGEPIGDGSNIPSSFKFGMQTNILKGPRA